MFGWIGQGVNLNGSRDSIYQTDASLGDVCSHRHSHLTLPWRCEDIMCSSQALIWQGFSASESKDVTAVWGGTRCKRGIIQLQRQGSALSLPSSSFAIYLSGCPQCASCFTGCRHHCASDKRSRWKPVHARMKQTHRLHPKDLQDLERCYIFLSLDIVHAGGKLPRLHDRFLKGEAAEVRLEKGFKQWS